MSREEDIIATLFSNSAESIAERGLPKRIWVSKRYYPVFEPFLHLIPVPVLKSQWIDHKTYVMDWNDDNNILLQPIGSSVNGKTYDALYFDEARHLK